MGEMGDKRGARGVLLGVTIIWVGLGRWALLQKSQRTSSISPVSQHRRQKTLGLGTAHSLLSPAML